MGSNINIFNFVPSVSTPTVDPDAQAFITAASITDPTQQSAIDTLVTDLKGYGIWTKMKAIYPFVGGTASSHKFNLKDPRDLDAAFRLVFNGGITHDANGITGNGVNSYADTQIALNTLSRDDNSGGIYSRSDLTGGADFGIYNNANNGSFQFSIKSSGTWFTRNGSTTVNALSNTDSRGFFQMTRRNSSEYRKAKNNTKSTTLQGASDTFTNTEIIPICALRTSGTITSYSSRNYAFQYIGNTSLSDTELDNMNTAVQAFNTTLSRQV